MEGSILAVNISLVSYEIDFCCCFILEYLFLGDYFRKEKGRGRVGWGKDSWNKVESRGGVMERIHAILPGTCFLNIQSICAKFTYLLIKKASWKH